MSAFEANRDLIYERFLERQFEEGIALAQSSDLLDLCLIPAAPPHVVAEFHCRGLVREAEGEIQNAEEFRVGIWFPPDYLRRADPFQILRLFTPHVWHPNVSRDLPLVCIGRLTPGTALVDILYQLFDVLSYQKYNPREDDALNKAACAWARAHQDWFPIDRRPLKRRPLSLKVKAQ
jgi:hypothetical protein